LLEQTDKRTRSSVGAKKYLVKTEIPANWPSREGELVSTQREPVKPKTKEKKRFWKVLNRETP